MTSPSIRQAAMAATLLAIGLTAAACGDDAEPTESPATESTAAATPAVTTEPPDPEPTEPAATEPQATVPPATEPPATEPPATVPPTDEPATPSGPAGFDLGDNVRGTSVISGPDLMAGMDPSDPQQAKNIEALLEATGANLDQLTVLNAVAADGVTFVGALRVDRADAELAKAAYVESTFNDLGEPRTVESEVGGKSVTQVFDDAAPGQPPVVVYASADTVWLVSGTEEAAETVVESLP